MILPYFQSSFGRFLSSPKRTPNVTVASQAILFIFSVVCSPLQISSISALVSTGGIKLLLELNLMFAKFAFTAKNEAMVDVIYSC